MKDSELFLARSLDVLQGKVGKGTKEIYDLLNVALVALRNDRIEVALERIEVAMETAKKLNTAAKE